MGTTAGIDLGSDAIKGVVLKAGRRGPVAVIGAGTMPIADISHLPENEDRTLAIGEKLKELVKKARLKAETRRVGAAGSHASIRYLQIPPVPPWRLEMLVKYEVEERNEEKENNAYDFHIMDVPETNGQYTVIVGTVGEKYCNEIMGMAKSVGLGDVEIDHEAMALFSAYYHGHGYDPDKTVAVVDVGSDDVTVLICRNGALYYARTMMGGGRRFTQNLADDLKIEFAEAEELKKNGGEIVFDVAPSAAGASAVNRARIPRPNAAGGTTIMGRSAVRPAAEGGAPATEGSSPGASGGRVVARPGGAIPLRAPGASASTPAVPPAPATPAVPGEAPKVALSKPQPSDDLSLDILDLDVIDAAPKNNPPAPAVPATPPAPVAPPVATQKLPVPEFTKKPAATKPADDYELQMDEPKAPAASAAPVPSSAALPQKLPAAPGASTAGQDVIDLVPVDPRKINFAAKGKNGPVSAVNLPGADALESDLGALSAAGTPGALSASQPGVAVPEDREKRKRMISAALVREAASLCAAIENVMLSCKQQSRQMQMKLDRIYLTGGASKLKGLPEFMGRRLRVEVLPLEPLRQLSLNSLSAEQRDALKAEQHTFHTALGLALCDLRAGAQSFTIWPKAYKENKLFWARGAYLYYAAGAAAIAMGLLLYTPARNTQLLVDNNNVATKAVQDADHENRVVADLEKNNSELRHRLKTITDNVQSGDYFLNVLAEMKSKLRIRDDIYLTSISTSIPNVVIIESDPDQKFTGDNVPKNSAEVKALLDKAAAANRGEPNTFQAQRRVYIRGIARGPKKEGLIELIQNFYNRLVPFPNDPDNPQNLFKDIRPIWYSVQDNKKENYYLKEFILEAYTEKPPPAPVAADPKNKKGPAGKAAAQPNKGVASNPAALVPTATQPAAVQPQPVAPINPAPAERVEIGGGVQQVPQPANPAQPAAPGQQDNKLIPYLKEIFQNNPKPAAPQPTQPPQPIGMQPTQPAPAQPVQPVQPGTAPYVPPAPAAPNEAPAVPKTKRPRTFVTPNEPAPQPAAPVTPVAPAPVAPAPVVPTPPAPTPPAAVQPAVPAPAVVPVPAAPVAPAPVPAPVPATPVPPVPATQAVPTPVPPAPVAPPATPAVPTPVAPAPIPPAAVTPVAPAPAAATPATPADPNQAVPK